MIPECLELQESVFSKILKNFNVFLNFHTIIVITIEHKIFNNI